MPNPKRVLVVGVGSIGERHVRCLQATERAAVSICEIDVDLRSRIADNYALQRHYESLDEALGDAHDAAVICTPAHLHVSMARRLADAGVHLLIEKPLSTSLDGIDELCDVVRRRKVTAAVAYVLRAHPALIAMKQAIDSARFGPPVQLVAVNGQHFPSYRPAYRDIYYANRATGGGAIQDALTHGLNAGEWLCGPIDRVCADAAHQVLEGVEVEDTVHVIARHGDALASYALNQHQAPNESTITVVCLHGTVRFESHHNRWRWMTEPGGAWNDESCNELERDDLFVAQASAFLDAIEGRAAPLCSLAQARQTLRVNLAILESAESQQWRTVADAGA